MCEIEQGVKSREQTPPNRAAISGAAYSFLQLHQNVFKVMCTFRKKGSQRKILPSKTRLQHTDQSRCLAHRKQCVSRCSAVALIKFSQHFQKALLCHTPPQPPPHVKLMHFSRSITRGVWYSRPPAAVVAPSPAPPNEVSPGQEAINSEESRVSESALSGGRRSQLQLSMPALPHLCAA